MSNQRKLSVSGFNGHHVGSILPDVGLVTTQGIISKINDKSLLITNEKGDEIRVNKNDYQPSIIYSLLTDNQHASFEPSSSAEKYLSISESLRVLQGELDPNALVDVISDLVNAHATKTAYHDHSKLLHSNNNSLSSDAKLAFIKQIIG